MATSPSLYIWSWKGPTLPWKRSLLHLGPSRIIENPSWSAPSHIKLINTGFTFHTLCTSKHFWSHFLTKRLLLPWLTWNACFHDDNDCFFVVSPGQTVMLLWEIRLRLTAPIRKGKLHIAENARSGILPARLFCHFAYQQFLSSS